MGILCDSCGYNSIVCIVFKIRGGAYMGHYGSWAMYSSNGLENLTHVLHVQVKLRLISTLGCIHFRNTTTSMRLQWARHPFSTPSMYPPSSYAPLHCTYIQVTELVYVHSKCMIVDDKVAIIGSGKSRRTHTILCAQKLYYIAYMDTLFCVFNLGCIH